MGRKVFISYRREDTASTAGRLYDRLCQTLQKSDVFCDVTTIGGGQNFERAIDAAIAGSDVVHVLIGSRWLHPGPGQGRARLWADHDYVRGEVRAALQRDRLVLPILVDGARMPAPDSLPPDIRELHVRHALPLRHESFDEDAETIIRTTVGRNVPIRPWERRARLAAVIGHAAGGAVIALVGLLGIAFAHDWAFQRPISASIGDGATTLLLIATAVLGAVFGVKHRERRHRMPVSAAPGPRGAGPGANR